MQYHSISSYTTSHNCLERGYPILECLQSLFGFSDEVIVVDAGSDDGTLEVLQKLARQESRLKVHVHPVDFSHPRWAIHVTGDLKAASRSYCTADYCWQMDADEFVPEKDRAKIQPCIAMLKEAFEQLPIMMLPMVEFWGSTNKIRADFFTVKLRLSRNDPNITHGIPLSLRCYDDTGHAYPRPFDSDGCDYIWKDSGNSVEGVISLKADGFQNSLLEHSRIFNDALNRWPCVYHTAWLNLYRKVASYRDYWIAFHASKYNLKLEDTAENNVMFDKPWALVTDSDLREKARELDKHGPRFFHRKQGQVGDGRVLPFLRPFPESLRRWYDKTLEAGRVSATQESSEKHCREKHCSEKSCNEHVVSRF